MPIDYPGSNIYPSNVEIPADADPADGESVRVPLRQLADRTAFLVEDKTYAGLSVSTTATYGAGSSASTLINFGTNLPHSPDVTPSGNFKLVAPRAGDYLVEAHLTVAGVAGIDYLFAFELNGNSMLGGTSPHATVTARGGGAKEAVSLAGIASLDVDDELSLVVWTPDVTGPNNITVYFFSTFLMRRM